MLQMGRNSRVSIVTHYGLAGPAIRSWGVGFCAPFQTGPGAHPVSSIARAFLGVKQSGCGVNHPPSSSAKVKERVELYLCSPSVPLRHVVRRGEHYLFYASNW